ncbi:hypothetical protein SprV_0602215100 [Sparganum proliferum]
MSVFYLVKRAFSAFDEDCFVKVFRTFVRSQLDFAIQAWKPWASKYLGILEKVQRRATKLTKASSDLSSSYCFKLVNDSNLRTSSKSGQGSLLVAMSQTTLDKPVEESFSDDNVGGSPRTELLNSPTKERTASSVADADGESRGISSASSPFSPSSAPLSAENGLGRCSLTTQDSGVDETLDEVLEEERTRVAGANRKLRGEVDEQEEEGDYAGWVIEEKAREVFTLGTTSACPASMASPSSPVAVSIETAANGDNLDNSSSDRREPRLRRRRRRSRICPPAPPSSCSGRAVEVSKSSAKQSSSDGDTKASASSAVETGPRSSSSVSESSSSDEETGFSEMPANTRLDESTGTLSTDSPVEEPSVRDALQSCAVHPHIPLVRLTSLRKIIRRLSSDLPSDARTLLGGAGNSVMLMVTGSAGLHTVRENKASTISSGTENKVAEWRDGSRDLQRPDSAAPSPNPLDRTDPDEGTIGSLNGISNGTIIKRPKTLKLTFFYTNVQSILPKFDELKIHICALSIDVVSLTESWLSENVDDRELMLPGFQLFQRDRRERQGGGVVTYVKHGLLVSEKTEQFACSAETIWLTIRAPGSHSLEVLTVYRPPRSDPEADARLLEELGRFALRPDVLIMGDFNAPLIDWSSLYARGPELTFDRRFLDMALRSFLTQHVLFPTRTKASSSYCFTLVNDSNLRTSSKSGQGSLLVAMSQTTLDKPVEESFSDDNVGGSPRTELLNSPTKERTASSVADADGESRGISSASSPFSPSSAPLSAENGLGRCSLTTQDSGVDETLDEVLEEERTRVAGANRKLREEDNEQEEEGDYAGWVIEEKAREVFTLGTASACPASMASPSSPVAVSTETAANGDNLDNSSSDRREPRLRRRRRRSRICPPAPPSCSGRAVEISKSSAKQSSSDGDTKASASSAVETGSRSSRSIAEKRHRAEALAAERSRERLANLAAAEAAAEAARERARQLREARSQELRRRDEERRRNADERRKAFQAARQDRTVPTIGRGASVVTNSGLSKSLRIHPVNGRVASSCLPRGFASELDPSDPRYCPYGFGSSCRREVCLTTSQLVKARNDQNKRHLLTTSFTADVKRSFHVPDRRMTTSATVNYSRPLGVLDTRGALTKHELTNKSAIQSQSDSSFKAITSKPQPRKLPEIRSMRIPPSLLKSTEASSQEKNGQKAFDKTSVASAKSRSLPTFARQKPTYAVNNPKPTRMSVSTRKPPNHGDVKMPTAAPLGRCQPRKPTSQQTAPHRQNPPAAQPPASMLSVKACADRRPLSPSTVLRDSVEGGPQVATTETPTKSITSVRGGAEPSDEEVAEYRARMKEQRRLALERREEEEMAISKETEQRVEQEAMNVIIREIAEVTVGEAIDQAIAELKAEAIQAAVMDEQTEQVQQHNSQNPSHSPSRLPQKAAFRLETAMQGLSMIPPAGEAITVSFVPAEGDPTVVLRSSTLINRSLSANDLQPPSESDKNLIQMIVTTSKDRLNKGIEEMATAVGEKWDKNAQTLALRTLSNVTAEAAEREERKRRLQQVMLRIRTPHGSSASLAAEDSEANSSGPEHFFADSTAQPDDHPDDQQPLTPTTSAHRSPIQFKPNALLSVLESGRLPKNSRAAALLRERVTSPTVINTPKNHDGSIPSELTKTAEGSQDGGPVDLTSDEDVEDDRSSTQIQGLPSLTTDLVTPVKPPHQMADSGAAGEETNGEEEAEARAESIAKEERAGGVPQNGAQFGLDEEQDIPLSLSALGPEHSAVLRHSILVRDPQSKLSHADLEVFNAVGDASPRPAE